MREYKLNWGCFMFSNHLFCEDPALVLPVVRLQASGTPGLRGLVTNNDGLLTRELLKTPQVPGLLSKTGWVRQSGSINVLTVSVRVQAAVTFTSILKKVIKIWRWKIFLPLKCHNSWLWSGWRRRRMSCRRRMMIHPQMRNHRQSNHWYHYQIL